MNQTKLITPPVSYVKNAELPRTRQNQAVEAVTFKIERHRMQIPFNGQMVNTDRDAIVRVDGQEPEVLGYVGTDYNLIRHEDALTAAFEALNSLGVPYEIAKVQLDRGGARMYTQFKFNKSYEIGQGDVLNPILTLVNGIDGYNALGFDLESIRLVCMNLARASAKDVSQKFMHAPSLDVAALKIIAEKSINQFENTMVPLYKKMASTEITKDAAIRAVAFAVDNNILPANVGQFAKHCVESDRAIETEGIRRTMWALFNSFTWAATKRAEDASATRIRDINAKIGVAFGDGGTKLLRDAMGMDERRVVEIMKAA
jgi:hypothetical protein